MDRCHLPGEATSLNPARVPTPGLLSVVVPVYNEAGRELPARLSELEEYLKSTDEPYEIVVVDDGSLDETPHILDRWVHEPERKSFRLPTNRGKGAAVRTGLISTEGDRVVFMDADLATPLDQMPLVLSRLGEGCRVAIGSRGLRSSVLEKREAWLRERCGKLFNRFVQLLLLPGIWDTQCGFKAFDGPLARALAAELQEPRFGFDVELLYLVHEAGLEIDEIPIRWRHQGGSHVRFVRDGLSMVAAVTRIAWRARTSAYNAAARRVREAALESPLGSSETGRR